MLHVAVAAVGVANSLSIAADLLSMAAALRLLVPLPQGVGLIAFAVGITVVEVVVPYHRHARVLRWLRLPLPAYVGVLAVAHVSWAEVA